VSWGSDGSKEEVVQETAEGRKRRANAQRKTKRGAQTKMKSRGRTKLAKLTWGFIVAFCFLVFVTFVIIGLVWFHFALSILLFLLCYFTFTVSSHLMLFRSSRQVAVIVQCYSRVLWRC
jgi:Flp pilus assembly protein TadB